MTLDPQKLRIEGVYEQRQPGNFMVRVKVPGGALSAEQACQVATIAERFAGEGLSGFLQKPYDLKSLRKVLGKVLPTERS